MARYLIESSHLKQECLRALYDMIALGPEFLAKFDWGCLGGNHTVWAIVEAPTEGAARNLLPPNVRNRARLTAVSKFTPEQIGAFRQRPT